MVDALIEIETAKVLDVCGLCPLANAWQQRKDFSDMTEMSTFPGLTTDDREASIKDVYASLFTPP